MQSYSFLANLFQSNFFADNAVFLICVLFSLVVLSYALFTVFRKSTPQESAVFVIVLVGSMLLLVANVLAEGVIYLRLIH